MGKKRTLEYLEKVRISRSAKYHLSFRKAEVERPSQTTAGRALKNKKIMVLEGYQKKADCFKINCHYLPKSWFATS